MTAVFRKEFRSYFFSPIGYIFLTVFWFFSGFYFFAGVAAQNTSDISVLFESIFMVVLLLIPILTMRTFSEEYRTRTDQLLFSAPTGLFSIVFGKFLAAFCIFAIAASMTLVYSLVVTLFVPVSITTLIGNVLGLLLLGGALISIGVFVSTLTHSQVVAGFSAFGIFLIFMYLDTFAEFMPFDWLKQALSGLSFMGRYRDFTSGLLDISDILYFISIIAVFLFLASRVLEKKRWN